MTLNARHPFPVFILFVFFITNGYGQGQLNGSLVTRAQFFIRDSAIGATGTPQYDRQLYGAESWLALNYSNWGFQFVLRMDWFQNSNLFDPQGSYSGQGIGRWYVRKKIDFLDIQAGYIYDQIGSGILFRAYEDRTLGIDNALAGIHLTADLPHDWRVKAFTGRQKNRFDLYESNLKGLALEGYQSDEKWSWSPGLAIVNKTLADVQMNSLVANLNTYDADYQFVPKYNAYGLSTYHSLGFGNWSVFTELAYKTRDVQIESTGTYRNAAGDEVPAPFFIQKPGHVWYSSLNYGNAGLGFSLEYKQTRFFSFRTAPNATLNQGMINYLPPMTRQNTYRLTTLYVAATQEAGEDAMQGEVFWSWSDPWRWSLQGSLIDLPDGTKMYREIFSELQFQDLTRHLTLGVQHQQYNKDRYEGKPGEPMVKAYTAFAEFFKQADDTHSWRFEAQYQYSQHGYGSWIYGLAEYGIAPKWLFSASNMYNYRKPDGSAGENYYALSTSFQQNGQRLMLSYVRQVEGVVCSGGICRYEPAFNGFRINLWATF